MTSEARRLAPLPDSPPTSWDVLAGLRFALAAVVVVGHVRWLGTPTRPFVVATELDPFTAVLCFLVISGYSMAHSITARPVGFLVRRLTRIYPLYALGVLAAVVPDIARHDVTPRLWHDLVLNLFFLDTFRSFPITGNGVVWTLAVEVAFYVLTPALARLRSGPLLALLASSAAAFVVYPRLHLGYYNYLTHGRPMLFLGWAWLAGFIYYRHRRHPLAGPALIAFAVVLTTTNQTWAESRHELTLAVSLLAVVAAANGLRLSDRMVRVAGYGGDLSYPLYLFHTPVILTCAGIRHATNPWLQTAVSVVTAAIMLAFDHRVKGPFTRLVTITTAAIRPVTEAAGVVLRRAIFAAADRLPWLSVVTELLVLGRADALLAPET